MKNEQKTKTARDSQSVVVVDRCVWCSKTIDFNPINGPLCEECWEELYDILDIEEHNEKEYC